MFNQLGSKHLATVIYALITSRLMYRNVHFMRLQTEENLETSTLKHQKTDFEWLQKAYIYICFLSCLFISKRQDRNPNK